MVDPSPSHGVIVDDCACDCDGRNEATKPSDASGLIYNSGTNNKKEKRHSEGNEREKKKGKSRIIRAKSADRPDVASRNVLIPAVF